MPGWSIGIMIAALLWIAAVVALAAAGRRTVARELAMLIPNLLQLFRALLGDPRVSRSTRAWIWFAVAWLVSPIDLIPEFVPIAGPLDDAIVAALVLRHVLRRTDPALVSEHWRGDPATLARLTGDPGGGTSPLSDAGARRRWRRRRSRSG